MAELRFTGNTSLDGYVNDAQGEIGFTEPSEEVFVFISELEREVGTYLYGRRLYETMLYWENFDDPNATPAIRSYAELWQDADKVVFSRTLDETPSARTRLMREFDASAVRALKAEATVPISVGGATLAAQAIRDGLVDDIHQFVHPVVIGGGTRFLPADVRLELELVDDHRFADGVVYLHYRNRGAKK